MSIRDYPDVPRVYCDMDGVIADFERGMVETKLPASKFKLIPGSYINLHPMEGAIEGVHELIKMGGLCYDPDKDPIKKPSFSYRKDAMVEQTLAYS